MSVCNDQASFNEAVGKAIDHYKGKDVKGYNTALIVVGIIWLIFTFLAVMVAMRVPDKDHKTLHIFFAILNPFVYLLSSWL